VREGGPVAVRRRSATGGRGRLLAAAKPALQGAFAGQQGRIDGLGQAQPQVAGAPGGMLLTQGQGRGMERVVGNGASGTGLVGGLEVLGLPEESSDQSPDRAGAKVQRVRNGSGGSAATGAVKNEAAEGHGECGRHDNPRRSESGLNLPYTPALARPNLYVGISGPTYCRVTAPRSPRFTATRPRRAGSAG
jgi:hypothetical protein